MYSSTGQPYVAGHEPQVVRYLPTSSVVETQPSQHEFQQGTNSIVLEHIKAFYGSIRSGLEQDIHAIPEQKYTALEQSTQYLQHKYANAPKAYSPNVESLFYPRPT